MDFYLCQFLSNFLRYSLSNFLLFYLYNIFAICFLSNSLYLESCSSATYNLFYLLTSILILLLKSTTTSLIYPKSFSPSYISYSTINLFQCTKYFIIPLIFHLFDIILTSNFSSPSTFTDFCFFIFYLFTSSLYFIIWLCHKHDSTCIFIASTPILTNQVVLEYSKWELFAHMWNVQKWQQITEISDYQ